MEGHMLRPDRLVAITEDQAAPTVDHKRHNGEDSESPWQPQVGYHGIGGQGVCEATKSRARCRHSVGKGTSLNKPLGHYTDCCCKTKPQTNSKTHSLA